DPQTLLAFLRDSAWASHRKLRLFGAACCRAVWAELTDPAGRRAVEVAERYADGKAGPRALAQAKEGERAMRAAFQAAALKGAGQNPGSGIHSATGRGPASPRRLDLIGRSGTCRA